MIPVPPSAVKWGIIAALAVGALAGAYFKGHSAATLAAGQRIGALEQALTDNETVIVDLRSENQRWRQLTDRWRDAAEGAVARAAREEYKLRRQNERLKREIDEVYRENPEAAEWAAVRVPAGVADRLRQ